MSNVSKCFSCAHKNDYDPKFGYFGCNLSGQECKGYSMFEPKAKPKPTNGDQLRAMSDEELADWIETIAPSGTYQFWLNGKTWLQWLRQEAGRDGRAD